MPKNHPPLKNIRKIAVLRANALGDFIVTLPALNGLRKAYPEAEIVLLGKPWHQDFLKGGRTVVDRVIVVPVMRGIRSEKSILENEEEVFRFIEHINNEHFDLIINMQGNGVSANTLIKKMGGRITAGLCCQNSEKLDICVNYYYYQNETSRFMEIAAALGATTFNLEPEIRILEDDVVSVQKFLSRIKGPFAVLHPIAMDKRRMWPVENYAALADHISNNDIDVIFTGAADDASIVDGIINQMKGKALNVCGQFSLGQLSAVLSKAAWVAGADTGPLHLARAVNTPTIGFYWAPNLINWGPITRSIHRPLVSWKMECPICGTVPNDPYPFEPQTNDCSHDVSFVQDISVTQAIEAIDEMLQMLNLSSQRVKELSL